MKTKAWGIVSACVLLVAGIATLVTSRMIAAGMADQALLDRTYAVLVVSGVLTRAALVSIAARALVSWRQQTRSR
ncbi:MAG: hypothetical protein GXY79_01230 [Chloroflexi bacterium]|mgnify:CR=1 FL=1|nr:hypothetical protein [Chloroflexota bacterium]